MWISYLLLFVLTMIAGLAPLFIPKINSKFFHLALVFSGAYLFGITIMHLLPELFTGSLDGSIVAVWIIAGFFMQLLLDYITTGVEHGHLHVSGHDHQHGAISMVGLLVAMGIHSLMEGALLNHPGAAESHQHNGGLLMGIILHKMPAAFALMSLIQCNYRKWQWPVVLMTLFALATPVGIAMSGFLTQSSFIQPQVMTIIFALVTGNFLHISTTILFESSPAHKLGGAKLMVILGGAGLAMATELLS